MRRFQTTFGAAAVVSLQLSWIFALFPWVSFRSPPLGWLPIAQAFIPTTLNTRTSLYAEWKISNNIVRAKTKNTYEYLRAINGDHEINETALRGEPTNGDRLSVLLEEDEDDDMWKLPSTALRELRELSEDGTLTTVATTGDGGSRSYPDPLWEHIQAQARQAVAVEPEAGPQLYQGILSQPCLLRSVCTIIAHQIETELMPAISIQNLFWTVLTSPNSNLDDERAIRRDLQAAATRSPSTESAMTARTYM
jgi:hypothetical protein